MSTTLPRNGKVQLAVVTGGHTFNVPSFYSLFQTLPGVDFYPQALDEFTADEALAATYDVVLFYIMHQFQPGDFLPWYQEKIFSTLEQLGHSEQGICVLHHALVAFPLWSLWSELVGIENRRDITPHFNQQVPLEVADAQHPIVQGLDTQGYSGWTLHDETYEMASPRPEDGNHLLLTTTHPRSMKAIAWTRTFRKSRVFCCQSGHDAQTFGDANFRRLLSNAIQYLR